MAAPAVRPFLSAGYASIALRMQEASMSNNDVARRLRSALEDAYRNTGNWCYIIDVFGTDVNGDVVYECGGDLKKASYTCSASGAVIDTAKAMDVVPLTTYEIESTSLTEAGRRNSSRDLKQLQSIHDNCVSLGASCSVKESDGKGGAGNQSTSGSSLKLVESVDWRENTLELIEAAGDSQEFEIKLISPGKGSTAFYTKEVLQREAEKFKKGTQIYINHATAAEESARPEGDWHKLAGALSTDGYWKESAKYGEGVFAKALFSSDYAPLVKEKAPFSGMSIRANGTAVMEGKRPVVKDGLPLLDSFTHIESVDVVTKAGRGGMILTEAARAANLNEGGADDMDAAELKTLKESLALREANEKKLLERALRGDAREFIASALKGITLHEAGKELVIESVMRGEIPQKDGALDEARLKEAIDAEAKRVGVAIAAATGSGQVRGLGTTVPVVEIDAKEVEKRKAAQERRFAESVRSFRDMGMPEDAAKRAASRGMEEVA